MNPTEASKEVRAVMRSMLEQYTRILSNTELDVARGRKILEKTKDSDKRARMYRRLGVLERKMIEQRNYVQTLKEKVEEVDALAI